MDISLDNLSPLGKMQKSYAPSIYELQQQRMGQAGPAMGATGEGVVILVQKKPY